MVGIVGMWGSACEFVFGCRMDGVLRGCGGLLWFSLFGVCVGTVDWWGGGFVLLVWLLCCVLLCVLLLCVSVCVLSVVSAFCVCWLSCVFAWVVCVLSVVSAFCVGWLSCVCVCVCVRVRCCFCCLGPRFASVFFFGLNLFGCSSP